MSQEENYLDPDMPPVIKRSGPKGQRKGVKNYVEADTPPPAIKGQRMGGKPLPAPPPKPLALPSKSHTIPRQSSIPEITKMIEALKQNSKSDLCDASECSKPYEVICNLCDKVLCYKCGKSVCEENLGKKHEVKDFDDSLEETRRLYNLWLTGKKNKVTQLDREKKEVSLLIKNESLKLANSSFSAVLELTTQIIAVLTVKLRELKALTHEHAELERTVKFHNSNIKELSNSALVKLTRELTIPEEYEENREYNIGDFETLMSKTCEYLTMSPDGIILASTLNSVSMFKADSSHEIGTVPLTGHVGGFQSYETKLYCVLKIANRGDKIAVFDKQYVQTTYWMVDFKVCDLAVSNDRVYLSESSIDCKIHVYSTIGTELYVVTEGAGQRVASHAIPDLIIVTNHSDDKAYGLDGRNKKILWAAEVEKPWGAFVDEFENIWVWSEFNQGFFIFDDKGNQMQEVSHPKLTGIGDVNSFCIKDGTLWVGFDGGLHKFQIGYC